MSESQLFEVADPEIRVELTFDKRPGPINWDHGRPRNSTYPVYAVAVRVGDKTAQFGWSQSPGDAIALGSILARKLGVELEGVPDTEAAA